MNRLKFGTYKQQVSFRKEIIEIEDHIPNKPTQRKNIDKNSSNQIPTCCKHFLLRRNQVENDKTLIIFFIEFFEDDEGMNRIK